MILKQEADEKVVQGWLRVCLIFEVLAALEETTKSSLENLINKLEKDSRVKLYKKEFSPIEEVEKPMKNIEKGFSQICETELITKNFDNLVQIVIEYGPSSVELLEPKRLEIDQGEAQGILNTISEMMHRFAAAGIGGVIIVKGG